FFFQAEDGIRDFHVTGVQTCALPILYNSAGLHFSGGWRDSPAAMGSAIVGRAGKCDAERQGADARTAADSGTGSPLQAPGDGEKIGRASCRESVQVTLVDVRSKKKSE